MIYFLVNNNIHLIDAEEHLQHLKGHPTALIKIPHKLTITPTHKFDAEYEYPNLINGLKDCLNVRRINAIHQKIKKELKDVSGTDTLVFYTEYEFLNHFVVKLFKEKGARTLMIDEGFPTYESLLKIFESSRNLKATILEAYFKHLFGYSYTSVLTVNSIMRPRIADTLIDKVLLYNKVNVERELDAHLLNSKEYIYPSLNENRVLFLNERLYDYYVTMDEYLSILDDILFNLSNQFEKIYFKFHPREGEPERQILTDVVKKYEKVTILDINEPAEFIIDELNVKYIASFLAQILLNHSNSNCKVLYLFHKYPAIMKNKVFINLKKILTGLNYTFFNQWEEIRSGNIGFSDAKQAKENTRYLSTYIK